MAIFIDAHVHIYPGFDRDFFLKAAFTNFLAASKRENLSPVNSYVLAMAESRDNDVFLSLCRDAAPFATSSRQQSDPDALKIYKTEETDSLLVRMGEHTLFLLAGRQLISKENIEVISLSGLAKHTDREWSLDDLVKIIVENGGIAVIPWGVGKWLGERGKVIKKCIETSHGFPLFIGDNGNRPFFWPVPSLFSKAEEHNVQLLSGSDPLPFVSHSNRAASSGTLLLKGEISRSQPAASLRKQLAQPGEKREFGERLNSIRFVFEQFRLAIPGRFL